MKLATAKRLKNILEEASAQPEKGYTGSIEAFAVASFNKFEKGIIKLLKEGDIPEGMISIVGVSIEAQYKKARNAHIRIGMLNLMIRIAKYCYRKDTDKDVLAKANAVIDKWKLEMKEAKAVLKQLKTLSPDDILNAPPIKKE